jgi:hypothetical protein
MPAARKPAAATAAEVHDTAKDLALDWLMRAAYPHAALFHARGNIEQQYLADEVKAVLYEVLDRISD